ncbi:MAG TPA: DUF4350 domain-containing protein [Dehalococcoidia bacterium]|jgi:hypothetical protein|nr:DUF4350 domain-containing protein [Dehalococcoidia bacterium]
MNLRKFLAMLSGALLLILAIVAWFFPSNEDFRTENPFWNGAKEMSLNYPVLALESLLNLPASPQGATLILIPYLKFSPAELEALNSFVSQGGRLILADDYGYGNQVLEYLGLKARFSRHPLLDPLANYKSKWFPRISRLKESALTTNIDSLVLNHATSLTNVEDSDVLGWSSSFSFLDHNGDQLWQEGEPTGPLAVVSSHALGKGEIVLIADPSLFINSMSLAGNEQLRQNIAATSAKLLLDQSHLPPSNLHQTKSMLAYLRGSLTTPLGTLGVVILALTITLMPLWQERRRK